MRHEERRITLSIKERQIENERQRVLLRELRAGRYPNISYIQSEVGKKFKEKPAGLPRFELRPAVNHDVSNSKEYNTMVDEAHEDLLTAFQELSYHADRMMSLADYYDTEKYNINLEVKKINRMMEELEEKLKDRGLRHVIFDTFNDYTRLEFEGNKSRSLPATNAFVDLRNGYTTLETVQNGKDKIDISRAEVTVKPVTPFVEFTELSFVSNALNDMINEAWRHQAVKEEASDGKITMTISFDDPIEMNMISLITQSPRETKVSIKTHRQDGTVKDHIEKEVFGYAEWFFTREAFTKIEITFHKTEPDVVLGANYYYYFGAENISVRNVDFMPEGYVTSAAHYVDRILDKVTLHVDESVPPDTSIRYFVAEDEKDDEIIEWRAIAPGGTVDFARILLKDVQVEPTAKNYGNLFNTYNNHSYYVVSQLSEKPISRSIELYMGSMMVQVDEYAFAAGTSFAPTLEQWKGVRDFERKYVSIDEISGGNTLAISPGTIGRMTMHITMNQDYLLMANPITIENVECTVYLNNMQVKGIAGDYTYNFKKGVNKLEIIYYAHSNGQLAPNLSRNYMTSIGMIDLFAQSEPMQEVTLYDLQNNTSKKDYTRFALDENYNIIVNYNPLAINAGGDGVRYKLKYKYKKPNEKDDAYLRFMAILSRKDNREDITPVLNSYKLIVE